MTWETVPWMVGGGALHSAEIGRLLAYAAMDGGNAGVMTAPDCKVTALGTPGASVNIGVGAVSIPCRAAGQLYQNYIGRMPTQDTAAIAVTTTTARNDLIVAQVEDPWLAGEPWADPPAGSEGVGPYIFTRVISGVAASVIASNSAARAYLQSIARSAIPLAGLALPANTAAVTGAMITDLRALAKPRRQRYVNTYNPGASFSLTAATFTNWGTGSWPMDVPSWATSANIVVSIGGVFHSRSSSSVNGTANGTVRAILGSLPTQSAAYDFETTNTNVKARYFIGVGDKINVQSIAGTTQTLTVQGLKAGGNVAVALDTGSFVTVDVEFIEAAI